MQKRVILLGLLLVAGTGAWLALRTSNKDLALQTISELEQAIASADLDAIRKIVVVPAVLEGRSQKERDRLLLEILKNEMTPQGITLLRKSGRWGPLLELFPDEAIRWTEPTGVDPSQCLAFRRDTEEFRTEVVLFKDGENLRVLRCNDVR